MTPVIWALTVGATFFGCLLSTVSGLGSALVLLPLLTFALGAPHAVAMIAPVALVSNFAKVAMMRAHVDRRALLLLMTGAVPGAAVGAFSVGVIPDDWLQRGLGVWLIGYAALAAWRHLKDITAGDASRTARQRLPEAAEGEPRRAGFQTRGHSKLIAYGAVTGVMSGALGVGGARRDRPARLRPLKAGVRRDCGRRIDRHAADEDPRLRRHKHTTSFAPATRGGARRGRGALDEDGNVASREDERGHLRQDPTCGALCARYHDGSAMSTHSAHRAWDGAMRGRPGAKEACAHARCGRAVRSTLFNLNGGGSNTPDATEPRTATINVQQ